MTTPDRRLTHFALAGLADDPAYRDAWIIAFQHAQAIATADADLDDAPAIDAPTDTCTCHCWANHPNQPARCEAASQPGLAIDQQPVCHGCWAAAHTPGSHNRGHSLTIPWNETRGWDLLGYTTEDDLDAAMRPQEDQ